MKGLKKLKAGISLLFLLALFLLLSHLVQTNLDFFESLIVNDFLGMSIYFILHVLAIVVAPITVFPLIAVATGLWGWIATFFITLVAWELGGIIAFVLARKWGVPLVKKLISLKNIYMVEDKVSKYGNGFWEILFLRMIIPIDGLSYAIGLFSKIKFLPYSLATLIGIIPFLFLFSYFGAVDFIYQLAFILIVLVLFMFWFILREFKKSMM